MGWLPGRGRSTQKTLRFDEGRAITPRQGIGRKLRPVGLRTRDCANLAIRFAAFWFAQSVGDLVQILCQKEALVVRSSQVRGAFLVPWLQVIQQPEVRGRTAERTASDRSKQLPHVGRKECVPNRSHCDQTTVTYQRQCDLSGACQAPETESSGLFSPRPRSTGTEFHSVLIWDRGAARVEHNHSNRWRGLGIRRRRRRGPST